LHVVVCLDDADWMNLSVVCFCWKMSVNVTDITQIVTGAEVISEIFPRNRAMLPEVENRG